VKAGSEHHVPLTEEMLALLDALPGCGGYTVHGFRSSFRD
jgi:hypothetical protein